MTRHTHSGVDRRDGITTRNCAPDGSIHARDLIRSRGPWEFARTVATCLAGVVVVWLLMVAF